MDDSKRSFVISVTKADGQHVRRLLSQKNLFDGQRKILVTKNDDLEIPVVSKDISEIREALGELQFELKSAALEQDAGKNANKQLCYQDLYDHFKQVLITNDLLNDELMKEVPKHWEKHDDLIIFPINSFINPIWSNLPKSELWPKAAEILKVKNLAKKSIISDDNFRSPKVELLLTESAENSKDFWATKKENGILYTWNITKSMFSVGNITEKQRISKFDCSGQVIVDLFAGVGYFTLTYLIHAKAEFVYACEWNPEAVKALKLNLAKNKVEDQCTVLEGDNRKNCPKNVANHVNLGLLPTSTISYKVACEALKQDTGGILHIHANVRSSSPEMQSFEWKQWCDETETEIQGILGPKWTTNQEHLENVKSFAPRVHHLVLDLKCIPKN